MVSRDRPARPGPGTDELWRCRLLAIPAPFLCHVHGVLARDACATGGGHRPVGERVQQLPPPLPRADRRRQARRGGGGRPAARLPDDLARRGVPVADQHDVPQPHVHRRRGDDSGPADGPAVQLLAGPMMPMAYHGERLGACTDCRRFWAKYRAGGLSAAEIQEIEGNLATTAGTCAVMGTASTMAALAETLGMALPGTAAIPAVHADRLRAAEASGRQAVALAAAKLRPSQIITGKSVENALRVLLAIGGSTNAIIHLTAIAGRVGVPIPLAHLNELSDSTPVLVDLKPTG